MNLVDDRGALLARLSVTFARYFIVVAYALLVLRRFGTLLTALPLLEGLLLILLGALGCFFVIRSLDRWLASFDAHRKAGLKPL